MAETKVFLMSRELFELRASWCITRRGAVEPDQVAPFLTPPSGHATGCSTSRLQQLQISIFLLLRAHTKNVIVHIC